jgi:1,4-alpha-glucan branching enzyme
MVMTKRKSTALTRENMQSTKKITFKIMAPEANDVFLVGDFNGWNMSSHPLKSSPNGTWNTSIELAPGRYEYRFLVDGEWQNDPNCTTLDTNPYGGDNCVFTLD